MNNNGPGLLRLWPKTGVWQVGLYRREDGELACNLRTGHQNEQTGEIYIWGLRETPKGTILAIMDKNPAAVAGDTIRLFIDRTLIGSFKAPYRFEKAGMSYLGSEVFTPEQRTRILNLMRTGGSIEFATEGATYTASLDGTAESLRNFDACLGEAEVLAKP